MDQQEKHELMAALFELHRKLLDVHRIHVESHYLRPEFHLLLDAELQLINIVKWINPGLHNYTYRHCNRDVDPPTVPGNSGTMPPGSTAPGAT